MADVQREFEETRLVDMMKKMKDYEENLRRKSNRAVGMMMLKYLVELIWPQVLKALYSDVRSREMLEIYREQHLSGRSVTLDRRRKKMAMRQAEKMAMRQALKVEKAKEKKMTEKMAEKMAMRQALKVETFRHVKDAAEDTSRDLLNMILQLRERARRGDNFGVGIGAAESQGDQDRRVAAGSYLDKLLIDQFLCANQAADAGGQKSCGGKESVNPRGENKPSAVPDEKHQGNANNVRRAAPALTPAWSSMASAGVRPAAESAAGAQGFELEASLVASDVHSFLAAGVSNGNDDEQGQKYHLMAWAPKPREEYVDDFHSIVNYRCLTFTREGLVRAVASRLFSHLASVCLHSYNYFEVGGSTALVVGQALGIEYSSEEDPSHFATDALWLVTGGANKQADGANVGAIDLTAAVARSSCEGVKVMEFINAEFENIVTVVNEVKVNAENERVANKMVLDVLERKMRELAMNRSAQQDGHSAEES